MREHSGMVTTDTTTTQVNFVVSPLKNRAHLEKNDYIALNHPMLGETCPIIATVTEIKSYEQVAGSTLSERLGKMMGTAKIIGYVDLTDKNKKIHELVSPPDPGSRVYLLYSEFLETVFAADSDGEVFNPPLLFGKQHKTALNQKETTKRLNYYLDPKNFIQTHTLITGISNSGKTKVTKTIINELANKTQQPVVVFDPFNEYEEISAEQVSYKTEKVVTLEKLDKSVKQKQVTVVVPQKSNSANKTSFYTKAINTIWNARNNTIPFI